jgi:hypothetical protein
LPRVSVVEARGKNPEVEERPPLKADTRGVLKREQTEKTKCVL